MNEIETGGPAFPCEILGVDEHGEYRKPWQGMNLRDYFATHTLVGALTQQGFADGFTFQEKAEWVYKMADAMLEARK